MEIGNRAGAGSEPHLVLPRSSAKNGCVLKQTEVRTARRGCRRSAHGAGQEYLRRSTYTSNKGEEHMHVRRPDALARVSQNTDGVHP